MVTPIWLPLPEFAWLATGAPTPADPSEGDPALFPAPSANPAVFAIVVTQPAAKIPPGPDDPAQKAGDGAGPGAKAEAFVIDLPGAPEENASPAGFTEPTCTALRDNNKRSIK